MICVICSLTFTSERRTASGAAAEVTAATVTSHAAISNDLVRIVKASKCLARRTYACTAAETRAAEWSGARSLFQKTAKK